MFIFLEKDEHKENLTQHFFQIFWIQIRNSNTFPESDPPSLNQSGSKSLIRCLCNVMHGCLEGGVRRRCRRGTGS
jgi:hypothetical protein